jgi:hypothetical protein
MTKLISSASTPFHNVCSSSIKWHKYFNVRKQEKTPSLYNSFGDEIQGQKWLNVFNCILVYN